MTSVTRRQKQGLFSSSLFHHDPDHLIFVRTEAPARSRKLHRSSLVCRKCASSVLFFESFNIWDSATKKDLLPAWTIQKTRKVNEHLNPKDEIHREKKHDGLAEGANLVTQDSSLKHPRSDEHVSAKDSQCRGIGGVIKQKGTFYSVCLWAG